MTYLLCVTMSTPLCSPHIIIVFLLFFVCQGYAFTLLRDLVTNFFLVRLVLIFLQEISDLFYKLFDCNIVKSISLHFDNLINECHVYGPSVKLKQLLNFLLNCSFEQFNAIKWWCYCVSIIGISTDNQTSTREAHSPVILTWAEWQFDTCWSHLKCEFLIVIIHQFQ